VNPPLRLGVNIDHVATVRNARGGGYPDPLRAAAVALQAGADGVTAHLREDRRHILDSDLVALCAFLNAQGRPLNLEIAAAEEMVAIAVERRPAAVCLVPERREERTTEGGLDVRGAGGRLEQAVRRLREEGGSRVSLFVEPDPEQLKASAGIGAAVVELHTGAYCDAWREGRFSDADALLSRLREGCGLASSLGLEVHAGHGLDFDTVDAVAALPNIAELNIGHFLIAEALFVGLAEAVRRMRARMSQAQRGASA
jgi:pyridoxine 5-phosphate synthase